MRVSSVETIPIREPEPLGDEEHWWVTSPMDVFLPPLEPRVGKAPNRASRQASNVIVRVVTDDGVEGLGSVGVGSPAAVAVIEHHLRPLVVGASPFDVELLWDRMFRTTLNLGRKGLVLEAISAIDIALWDIMGKATGQPVYNLLGGRTRDRIRAYVSQSYAHQDVAVVRDEAEGYVSDGFTALKMRFGYGPIDGRPGMRRNYELVRTVREAVGQDIEVMADAYMGWNATYAVSMINMLAELDLAWVEEPLVPDDLDGYARIRDAVSTPIAAGEHEFTRWGYRDMIQKRAVDIVQLDVNRMGGITEARKVWALAQAHDLPVIPHSPQAHNAHLILAHMNAPLIEYFPQGTIRAGYTFYAELFDGEPEAENGFVRISDAPGLGITMNKDVVERYRIQQ